MTERRPGNEIHKAAFRALQDFSRWFDSDPEMIESMSPQELQEEMRDLGLDPEQPIPHLPGCAPETPSIDARLRLGSDKIVLDTAAAPPSQSRASQASESPDVAASSVQLDRTRLLIAQGPDGECTREQIGALLEHPYVRKRLRAICMRFNFRCFAGSYSAEDLYQDTCLKVWKSRHKLAAPGNILNDQDYQGFDGWLFIVTRNQYYSSVRQFKRKNRDWLRSEKPIEDLNLAEPEGGNDGRYFLTRFLDFIKNYPEPRQHSLSLWLQGYSYREIVIVLRSRDVQYSHVTVLNWVTDAIKTFRRTLEAYDTEPARSRAVSAGWLQRHDDDHDDQLTE